MAKKNRINREITAPKVFLIGADNTKVGVVSFREALDQAEQAGLQLVEVAPNQDPPVCRILDHGRLMFRERKRHAHNKAKAGASRGKVSLKEMKFRPGTDVGDYQVKVRKIRTFLLAGHKVKVSVQYRGREMAHQHLGLNLVERVVEDLQDVAQVEFMPKLEGRQLTAILAPKKQVKSGEE